MNENYTLFKNWVVLIAILSIAFNTGATDGVKMTTPPYLTRGGDIIVKFLEEKQSIKVISGVGHIKLQNLDANDQISFYNLQGNIVAETHQNKPEIIMDLNSGVYIVKVNNQYTAKTIVY